MTGINWKYIIAKEKIVMYCCEAINDYMWMYVIYLTSNSEGIWGGGVSFWAEDEITVLL